MQEKHNKETVSRPIKQGLKHLNQKWRAYKSIKIQAKIGVGVGYK